MAIIGTAGHVDHGKSTLIRALTGRDPDRWAEEQERGLTIDLGFAWAELGPGLEVGFVDVPGHERFIKNMLAGIGGIDVAMLVVAADEGWMPQTEEHAAVLDLLGIDNGVVALTRVDVTDADTVELAALETADRLAGLSLQDWPIIPVAAPTGAGIDDLRAALAKAIGASTPADPSGRPRLWVDRTFTISGAGTVVTGTLVGGSLAVGDEVESLPGNDTWRIRQMQSHEADRQTAEAGSRVALNVVGGDRDALIRGTHLGQPGQWRETDRLVASIRTVRSHPDALSEKGAYRIHIGSGSQPARLRMLSDDVAVISPAQPVPVMALDRFVVRDVGRRAVVAGGIVLDPHPGDGRLDADYVDALASATTPTELAEVYLQRRRLVTRQELESDAGALPADAVETGGWLVDPGVISELGEALVAAVEAFHRDNPRRQGLPAATAASSLTVPADVITALVEADDRLALEGGAIRLVSRADPWDEASEDAWRRAETELGASLAVPRASSLDIDAEILRLAIRTARAVEIADDVVFLPEQLEEIEAAARTLGETGFTVADLRDRLGVSRRHAVPIVEWLDATGVTKRSGDLRILR